MNTVTEIPMFVQSRAATIGALRGRLEEAISASADAHRNLWDARHGIYHSGRAEHAIVLAARVHAARCHLAVLEAEQELDAALQGGEGR